MNPEYCDYPPEPASDLELAEQPDGARIVWVAGAASVGRYILLGEVERNVLLLIDGKRTPQQICDVFQQRYSGKLLLATLTKFLTKLEGCGLLAGERRKRKADPATPDSQTPYKPIKLFNPDRLFTRLAPKLRWIWTTGFFAFSLTLILCTLLLGMMNTEQVAAYATPIMRDHFLAIFVAAYLIGVTHEFAHGMTCKVFGGRATEVGVLLVYYFLFALYCNVSGIHLIPTRGRRLWVIAAGVYWQLIVGTFFFLLWFVLVPHTLLADAAFICFLGSVLDVFFNANPLIKLDGYYFLSQALRMPNLMDRSRAYWRGLLLRASCGAPQVEVTRYDRQQRTIYLVFGLLSFIYNLVFASLVIAFVSDWLIERFYLLGLLLALGVVFIFLRRPFRRLTDSIRAFVCKLSKMRLGVFPVKEEKMAGKNQQNAAIGATAEINISNPPFWRRRLVLLSLAVLAIVMLLMPWSASVGNYGTLIAIPDQETIIRAPESASLVALRVRPGDQVAGGTVIAQMGNLDLEEQIVAVGSDLARVNADRDRLLGDLHAREESVARAGTQLRQRQLDYDEIESERRQIAGRQHNERKGQTSEARIIAASVSLAERPFDQAAANYPAALAVLQAEADSARAQFEEAASQRDRLRKLNIEGIIARSELDASEMRAATCASALAAARQRLEAALIEHRRKHASITTEMNLANSDVNAERLQIAKLGGELNATKELIATLQARRDLLVRKRAQFELTTPQGGAIFGEELPRMLGQYFQKGAEICRIADTHQLLLRVNVPEREIGDIRTGAAVRLKTRAYPDRIFRGVVSKIAGESETDPQGQTTYRVELTIENGEGWLRPGMTAFARIDFDRQMVARILLHKIRQTLRPELWML